MRRDAVTAADTPIASPTANEHTDVAQDHPDDRASSGSERQPEPDFARAARNRMCHGGVEADARNRHREDRKRAAQPGEEDLLVEVLRLRRW